MLYAKQRNPEFQEDDLFFTNKSGELQLNDDYYVDNVIIDGNRDYRSLTTKAYEKVKRISSELWYDWEYYRSCGFGSRTEVIEYYLNRDDGKKYSKKDIHSWIELMNSWEDDEYHITTALYLITRKKWREISLRGYCQSEWQEGYASEELSDASVDYIELCYFNKGMEFLVYKSKEDFDNDGDCYSMYVADLDDLRDRLGEEVTVFEFTGYKKIPEYDVRII